MQFQHFLINLLALLMINCTPHQDHGSYSFFVAGHTYGGAGVNNVGLHPPFKDKFELINQRAISYGFLLGDIVSRNPTAVDWNEVDADVSKLNCPVKFVAGNHDVEDRDLFESRYGKTYSTIEIGPDLFIILDANFDGWNISGEQFEFLRKTLETRCPTSRNIYIMVHQLIWWDFNNIYKTIGLNSLDGRASKSNFWTDVEPLFHGIPNEVTFFAGDLGAASWSSDLMFDCYDNITFVGTGMGEGEGDNFVIVNVGELGDIDFELICLENPDDYCLGDLEDYKLSSPSVRCN